MKYLVFLFLAGCSADGFFFISTGGDAGDAAVEADVDRKEEAGDVDADVDAGDAKADVDADVKDSQADSGVCTQNGGTACDDVMFSYCTRYATCCQQGPSNGFCPLWVNGGYYTKCRAQFADCTAVKYTSKTVCASTTSSCQNVMSGATCNLLYQSPGPNDQNFFPGCTTFWSQFP